ATRLPLASICASSCAAFGRSDGRSESGVACAAVEMARTPDVSASVAARAIATRGRAQLVVRDVGQNTRRVAPPEGDSRERRGCDQWGLARDRPTGCRSGITALGHDRRGPMLLARDLV